MRLLRSNNKGSFLFLLLSFLSSLLLFSSQIGTALAAPVNSDAAIYEHLDIRAGRDIPTAAEVQSLIDPKKNDLFAKFAKNGLPPRDKAVFFTGQDPKTIAKIQRAVKANGAVIIRDIWKSDNFSNRKEYKGTNDADFKKFQAAFSTFYARKTSGTAYLIFPHNQRPASNGVFYSVELNRLIEGKQVSQIIWIDQNRIDDANYKFHLERKTYWKSDQPKPPA